MTSTGSARRHRAPAAGRRVVLALRLVLAAVFLAAGLAKLGGEPAMVRMFADIGAGDWLRPVVGVLEVAGAVGLLVRPLAGAAAAGLAGLMTGATVTNVVVLDTSPVLTVLLGLAAGGTAWALSARRGAGRRGLEPHGLRQSTAAPPGRG